MDNDYKERSFIVIIHSPIHDDMFFSYDTNNVQLYVPGIHYPQEEWVPVVKEVYKIFCRVLRSIF